MATTKQMILASLLFLTALANKPHHLPKRLISWQGITEWLSVSEIDTLFKDRVHFMDITEHQLIPQIAQQNFFEPQTVDNQERVREAFEYINKEKIEKSLRKFSSFFNRHYKSKYGKQSAEWLFLLLERIANRSSHTITVNKFMHNWQQFSVIARIEGKSDEIVVISAHLDSIAGYFNSESAEAPGADDNGSGSMTILEIFRILTIAEKPESTIEFHWYSAEEAGLLGSQAVSSNYLQQQINVKACLHMDMTGYNPSNEMGIVTDFVNRDLTNFVMDLAVEYLSIPIVETRCGYACSDHASWTRAGYPSAFAIESKFNESNPYIHSKKDLIENLDMDHIVEFVKLGLAFAYEVQ